MLKKFLTLLFTFLFTTTYCQTDELPVFTNSSLDINFWKVGFSYLPIKFSNNYFELNFNDKNTGTHILKNYSVNNYQPLLFLQIAGFEIDKSKRFDINLLDASICLSSKMNIYDLMIIGFEYDFFIQKSENFKLGAGMNIGLTDLNYFLFYSIPSTNGNSFNIDNTDLSKTIDLSISNTFGKVNPFISFCYVLNENYQLKFSANYNKIFSNNEMVNLRGNKSSSGIHTSYKTSSISENGIIKDLNGNQINNLIGLTNLSLKFEFLINLNLIKNKPTKHRMHY